MYIINNTEQVTGRSAEYLLPSRLGRNLESVTYSLLVFRFVQSTLNYITYCPYNPSINQTEAISLAP